MAETIKSTARTEAQHLTHLTKSALTSRTYIYPLRAIPYLLLHSSLRDPLFKHKILPALGYSAAAFAVIALTTYVPQAAVLSMVQGPGGPVAAVGAVWAEAALVGRLLVNWREEGVWEGFDGTLVEKGLEDLVAEGREVKKGRGDAVGKLGKLVTKPFVNLSPQALVRYFMYLPLNFIPVVGNVIFVVLQGKRMGPNAHERYFQLKGMRTNEREKFVEDRRGAYTSFGVMATVLEFIPVIGIFFAFTNAVGAALWAADMELKERAERSRLETSYRAESE
ncbi:MAG: hypothetical protein M1831_004479 [Alyxoria varia]|nr:MAG: hypothetical protein M1831_004479 [Alyxoria varia]